VKQQLSILISRRFPFEEDREERRGEERRG